MHNNNIRGLHEKLILEQQALQEYNMPTLYEWHF